MTRFIIVSFLFMGWAYYELSGGSEFVPEPWPGAVAEAGSVGGVSNDEIEATLAVAGPSDMAPVQDDPPTTDLAKGEVQIARADPDPSTTVIEPSDEPGVTFISLSASEDGTALTAAAPEPAAGATQSRAVDATLLNVRAGPSTGDGVIGQLTRGEEVTLVSSSGDGWSLIRLEGDGLEGWVANRFLVEN